MRYEKLLKNFNTKGLSTALKLSELIFIGGWIALFNPERKLRDKKRDRSIIFVDFLFNILIILPL